jgi:hypothetical protein
MEKEELLKKLPDSNESETLKQKPQAKTPPQYDPRKKYTWEPTDQFVFSGEEYATILNSFRSILSSPEGQRILMVERAHFIAESALARGLELGFVKEKEEPKAEVSGIPPLRKS